jgi:hypothetical protein
MSIHLCKRVFDTEKKDNCSGEGSNFCEGINPMLLSVWFSDTNGIEEAYDNWVKVIVNFCPFCGWKSEVL